MEQETNEAFNALKDLLASEPLLQYPDITKPFVLTTVASNEALGMIISQGPIGQDLPITYANRTLINAEKNYSTTEKEHLAIVWGCKQLGNICTAGSLLLLLTTNLLCRSLM